MGQPRANSVRAKLVEYFHNNPDEELTLNDVMLKVGKGSPKAILGALYRMEAGGELERERVRVWRPRKAP